jgi:hypothetical protein
MGVVSSCFLYLKALEWIVKDAGDFLNLLKVTYLLTEFACLSV